ncbi:MAG: flagellar basal body P-ring protein FlgI [Fibrobacterota bacterium]
MKKTMIFLMAVVLLTALSASAQVRVKDVARVEGLEEVQLIGYGLVVGLDGSGDGSRTMFTVNSIVNMLRNLGVVIPLTQIRVRNVAAVMVTSTLPAFTKRGAKLDVSVASLGDATSLEGGTLLMTPLQDGNGDIFAVAQGSVAIGGYSVSHVKEVMRKKNHPLAGDITGGAQVKKEILSNELNTRLIRLSLATPDFTSAVEMTKSINTGLNATLAKTIDAASVEISVPEQFKNDLMGFVSKIEQMEFEPSRVARVVINEKTGTIVAGTGVTIDEVAVSHGSISVTVTQTPKTVQPAPYSMGQTRTDTASTVAVEEEKPEMVVLNKTTNVGDLAKALNNIGASPRDIMSIFQAIKRAGALNAELVVM